MSVYIFKRIFKSDNINVDSVVSIYCSIVNIVFDKMSEADYDIDGANKDREKAKSAKENIKGKKDGKKKGKSKGNEMKENEMH